MWVREHHIERSVTESRDLFTRLIDRGIFRLHYCLPRHSLRGFAQDDAEFTEFTESTKLHVKNSYPP